MALDPCSIDGGLEITEWCCGKNNSCGSTSSDQRKPEPNGLAQVLSSAHSADSSACSGARRADCSNNCARSRPASRAMLAGAGAVVRSYGLAPDEQGAIERMLGQALAENDVVFVSGGSSVGARDLTLAAENVPGVKKVKSHLRSMPAAVGMGVPRSRFSVPSSRSVGIAIARFWNEV